jgi:holo-[acyl-carrier protein] synthase
MIKVGVDVVQIPRIESIFAKFGEVFCKRILHLEELKFFNDLKGGHCNYLAKRYAAKEAVSKAFGVGIGSFLTFESLFISKDQFGAPKVTVNEDVLKSLLPEGYSRCAISLSISDDYPVAIAFVLINFFPS